MSIKKLAISLLVGGLFVINGCGGGDGSTLPSKPLDSQMQKLSDSNADKSVKGVATALNGNYGMGNNAVPGAGLRVKSKLTKVARVSVDKSFRTEDASSICDSGSAKLNESSNTKGSITYNKCSIDGTVYNGKVDIEVWLNGGEIEYATVIYNNFSAKNSLEKLAVEIEYAKIYTNKDTEEVSISKMYATVKVGSKVEKYLNYNISTEHNYDNDGKYNAITKFKGYIKPSCSDGFVYIESLPSIREIADNDEDGYYITYTRGKFKIESKGKTVMVEIKSDDQIKITKPSGEVETMSKDEFDTMMQDECN